MGRGHIQYRLPASDREVWVVFSAFYNYRLPDGTLLSVDQQAAWCPHCRTFVLGERIKTVDQMEQRITELRNPSGELKELLAFVGTSVEKELADLHRRIEWRRGRVTPARCLHCGTPQIVPLPNSRSFAHPDTGATVIVESNGWTDLPPHIQDFTPEGEQLPGPLTQAENMIALHARLDMQLDAGATTEDLIAAGYSQKSGDQMCRGSSTKFQCSNCQRWFDEVIDTSIDTRLCWRCGRGSTPQGVVQQSPGLAGRGAPQPANPGLPTSAHEP
jgi:hypothetical protein